MRRRNRDEEVVAISARRSTRSPSSRLFSSFHRANSQLMCCCPKRPGKPRTFSAAADAEAVRPCKPSANGELALMESAGAQSGHLQCVRRSFISNEGPGKILHLIATVTYCRCDTHNLRRMEYPPPGSQMQAQLLEEYNTPYQLRTVPIPQATSPHHVIVKVTAAGYCHTDLAVASGSRTADPNNALQLPHIGCHEFAGIVIATAPAASIEAAALQIGTRVGVPGRGHGACGTCVECGDAGYSFCCPQTKSNGITTNGGFAEYAVVDARQCVALPDSMEMVHAAPLMRAGVTISNAIKRCEPATGSTSWHLRRGRRAGPCRAVPFRGIVLSATSAMIKVVRVEDGEQKRERDVRDV